MKNSFKSLLSSVLALAMVFSTFGIVVSANTSATVTMEESEYDTGVYDMAFTVKADGAFSRMDVVFSYDTEAIQPVDVNSNGDFAPVEPTDLAAYGGYYKNQNNQTNLPAAPLAIADGTRMGLKVGVYTTSSTINTTNGLAVLHFYYKIKDASKMNRDTFKLETSEEMLAKAFSDASERVTLKFVAGGATYLYGDLNGAEDTIATPTWTYTNSDKEPAVAKTQIDVSGVTVADITKEYDGNATEVVVANVPVGVTYTVTYSSGAAPVGVGEYTATVTLAPVDAENYELVNVPEDLTATITINEKPAVEETKDLSANGATTLATEDAIYEDLCIVDAIIAHGLEAGKTIVKWGVRFHDAANLNVGGGLVEFAPAGTQVTIEGGELTFKAAITGVPEGVTVKAVPFVVSK